MQKVAIPTDDGRTLSHFGRTKTVAVFTIEDGRVIGREDRPNPDAAHVDPAHHRVMRDLVQDCAAVIAGMMGPPLVKTLQHAGVQILLAPAPDVEGCLQAYVDSLKGGPALAKLTVEVSEAAHQGHHHDHHH